MATRIKCCPFCGSHEVHLCRTNPHACWVRCAGCGADAESNAKRSRAIENWNRRYQDDKPATIVEDDDRGQAS